MPTIRQLPPNRPLPPHDPLEPPKPKTPAEAVRAQYHSSGSRRPLPPEPKKRPIGRIMCGGCLMMVVFGLLLRAALSPPEVREHYSIILPAAESATTKAFRQALDVNAVVIFTGGFDYADGLAVHMHIHQYDSIHLFALDKNGNMLGELFPITGDEASTGDHLVPILRNISNHHTMPWHRWGCATSPVQADDITYIAICGKANGARTNKANWAVYPVQRMTKEQYAELPL